MEVLHQIIFQGENSRELTSKNFKLINLQKSIPKPASIPSLLLAHMEGPESNTVQYKCKPQIQIDSIKKCLLALKGFYGSVWLASGFYIVYWPVKAFSMLLFYQSKEIVQTA